MFTGCIDDRGTITAIENQPAGKRFRIACQYTDLTVGESIAVNGACLTVTEHKPNEFCCDLSPETLDVTTAKYLTVGSSVNLERSLRLNDRLDGHFVLGHVDQVCRVAHRESVGEFVQYTFTGINAAGAKLLVYKGSIAVNGVSLTLNRVIENGFEVMLIPKTLEKTNLGSLHTGDFVNIEYDYLAKLVTNQISSLTLTS
jgi:riboflavin synthase